MVFIAVVAGLIFSATVGFEAGQATPDTANLFTSIAEKNRYVHKARGPRGGLS
jgi:hypothetical protein